MTTFLIVSAAGGGYIASIYSWPWVREKFNGAVAEAEVLRQRARDLEAKIRG